MGSGRSSSTVMVNTHIPASAALLVFKMKAVKVSEGACGRECAGSVTVGELTVHCFCATLLLKVRYSVSLIQK